MRASRFTKAFSVVATVVTAVALTACTATKTGGSDSSGPIKIGFVTKTTTNPFFVYMEQIAQQEAGKQGVTLIQAAGNADGDNAGQVSAVENMIASGVKAIIIDPNDSAAIVPTLESAQQQGVFVVAVDSQTDGNRGVSASWATDNTHAGVLLGQYIKAALGTRTPNVAMLDLEPGVLIGDQRHNGFLQGFGIPDNSPEIVGRQDTNGDQGKGQTGMENLLQKSPAINVVYSINEPAGIGAATAISDAGKSADILLGSIDGGCTGVTAVRDGKLAATVMQFPAKMAVDAVDAVAAYLRNGTKPAVPAAGFIDTGEQLITDKPVTGIASQDTTWAAKQCWGGTSS
jgi:fructose transport system substrate-binding protein